MIYELTEVGIQVVPQFQVKIGEGQRFNTDIYISSPQRAVIEIKSGTSRSEVSVLRQARTQMEAVRRAFDGQVICVLVFISANETFSLHKKDDDWLDVVVVSGFDQAAGAAEAIRERLFLSLPAGRLAMLNREQLSDNLPETGPLSDVLVNFRTRIADDAFQVLRLEAAGFFSEYLSGHYTTSALCVGRMLEFMVYTLAKAWSVPVNKRTIQLLENLEGKFNNLSKAMVEYAYAESSSEKENAKNILHKDIAGFTASVTHAAMSLHEPHEKIDTEYPINIQSILRDIRKRYAHNEVVRNQSDILVRGSLITDVLKMRNRAAHADSSGIRTEYSQGDIDGMLENLRTILWHLGHIADAIYGEQIHGDTDKI